VTVALPVRNGASTLAGQLDALAAQDFTGEWEVIVADNGSRDGSAGVALSYRDRLPNLRVIDASRRRGAGHARNVALELARGAVYANCDADDVVSPGWLDAMVRATGAWDLVGGSVDNDELNPPRIRAQRARSGRTTALPVAERFLPYAVGCNCAVRTDVARALGGWREDYVDGSEDVEFSWRAQLAGYRLGYAPDALVYRRERRTLAALARQMYAYERATPRLHRDFADAGMPPSPWATAVRRSLWLVPRVWFIASTPTRRGLWVRTISRNAGWYAGKARLLQERIGIREHVSG
jgi:glycosyltransferase involved in cell wall biosynthesis